MGLFKRQDNGSQGTVTAAAGFSRRADGRVRSNAVVDPATGQRRGSAANRSAYRAAKQARKDLGK